MSNRIDVMFKTLQTEGKKALVAYVPCGYPNGKATTSIVQALVDAGVDLVELGVPFSDPLADGPTIQVASQVALDGGATPPGVLKQVDALRKKGIQVPIALLTYFNPVFKYGVRKFTKDAANSGVDGLVIPDVPVEESDALLGPARQHNVHTVFLASPTSPKRRLKAIAKASRGFIYYVSLTGVTGERTALSTEIDGPVKALKSLTKTPVCVGFGISKPEHVKRVAKVADGAIVGSALIAAIGKAKGSPAKAAERFIKPLRRAC